MEPLTLLALAAAVALLARGGDGARGPVQISRGRMTGPLGQYQLTRADVLWLGRAVAGEVSDDPEDWANPETMRGGAAVLWALAQNLLTVRRRSGLLPPFNPGDMTRIARLYCQPINPKYESLTSSGCVQFPHRCTPRRLARRRRFRTMQWSQLPAGIRQLVTRWAAGQVPNPVPGLVDWAEPRWSGAQVEIAGNWFGVARNRRIATSSPAAAPRAPAPAMGFVRLPEAERSPWGKIIYWGVLGGIGYGAWRAGHYAITGRSA
jgi:hypothetical protein